MDASLALLNAFLQTGAVGTPQVLPAATSDRTSTSNSNSIATLNHKKDKEKELRAKTNKRFEELYNLIKKEGEGKLSQVTILKAASKAAIEHKRKFHSDNRSRGLNAALQRVEQVTIQFLESLNLPYPANYTFLRKIEKLFEDFRDVVLPVSTPIAAPTNTSAPSSVGASTSDNVNEAKKEMKKNREQGRGDTLGDGYNTLKKFIKENNVIKTGNQKIQILEAIIAYLRHEPVTQLSQTADAELKVGYLQGRKLGQNLALQFFMKYLSVHFDSLQHFFISQRGLLDSSTHMDNFQIDKTAVMNFMSIHPTIINFDHVINPAPAPVADPVPAPKAVSAKFWRPWEEKDLF